MRGFSILARHSFFLVFSVLVLAWNARASEFFADFRPWAEYEKVGWLAMSSADAFGSLSAKIKMIEEMPDGMTALVYTQYNVDQSPALTHFGRFIQEGRVQLVHFFIIGDGTWTQDVMPVAVVPNNFSKDLPQFGLIGARHSLYFEPDKLLAAKFEVPLIEHSEEFEGGNFLATRQGVCMIVNGFREKAWPDQHFLTYYGCQSVIRFPHERDIGHIDERLKILSDELVLTDSETYKEILESHGFTVLSLPSRTEPYQNYLNSVLLNDRVFVPIFGDAELDEEALNVYRSTGLFSKVIPIESKNLVDRGTGGLHCLTATFPATQ